MFTEFFEGYTPEVLIGYFVLVILFFWPGFGVKLMNKIKEHFGWSAQTANNIVIGFLMSVALIALVVTGYFQEGFKVTLHSIIAVGGVCYTLSQVAYKRLFPQDGEGKK